MRPPLPLLALLYACQPEPLLDLTGDWSGTCETGNPTTDVTVVMHLMDNGSLVTGQIELDEEAYALQDQARSLDGGFDLDIGDPCELRVSSELEQVDDSTLAGPCTTTVYVGSDCAEDDTTEIGLGELTMRRQGKAG